MISLDFQVSIYIVAAICGNWWQESTINPGLYENRQVVDLLDPEVYGGYGLGQWTNAPQYDVYRRTDLIEWTRAHGYADDSGEGQLEFFLYEDTWYDTGAAADWNSLTDYLQSDSEDLDHLTEAFMRGWEGINDGTLGIRQEAAWEVYNYLTLHANDPPGDWIAGNNYLSNDDRLHNALLVYRYLNGYRPALKQSGGGAVVPIIASSVLRRRLRCDKRRVIR